MDTKGRIQQYIDYKGITTYRLEQDAGLSKGYWAKTKSISADTATKISRVYVDISAEWILRGEGDMINSSKINYENKGNPYYNVDFTCGFDLVLNDQTTNPEYYIDLLPFNKNGVVWCNASGHSMEPEINNGDIIAIKELKTNIQYLPFGEIYGIITDEFRTIKKLAKSDKEGYIRLVPTNKSPEFSEQDIPIDIITNIFQVVVSIKKF